MNYYGSLWVVNHFYQNFRLLHIICKESSQLEWNDNNIGKLVEQKMVHVIDYFVPCSHEP
jgi:hypothetical protein